MTRVINALWTIVLVFISTGCYAEMRGTVVDTESGEPIEGAVVLVEWTKKKGLGLTHTKSINVIEKTTDIQGKFIISKTLSLFSSPPDITIYKKGYIAWNNKFIFPDYRKRINFQWQNDNVFKMERFKDNYSFIDHESFIDGAINAGLSPESKRLFLKTYDDSEGKNVMAERIERDKLKRINKERKK